VFAPNSLHRVWVIPARRGKGSPKLAADQDEKTPAQPHVAMSWAQRLKRVFNIDVETCRVCGAAAKMAVPARPAPTAFVRPCTSFAQLNVGFWREMARVRPLIEVKIACSIDIKRRNFSRRGRRRVCDFNRVASLFSRLPLE
jgi:hypothetical protein